MITELSIEDSNLTPLSAQEIEQIMHFSGVALEYEQVENDLIHSAFESVVSLYPDEPAIIYYNEKFCYREINAAANQLACYLKNSGLQPGRTVAIYLDRSPWLVIVILAILKAGGAYVPLDPAYPEKRNQFILEDSQANIMLTLQKYEQVIQLNQIKKIFVDTEKKLWETYPQDNLNLSLKNALLSYVLYTSGTTGKPKGVAIEHRNCMGLLRWAAQNYSKNQLEGILAANSICFDLSIFEIFLPLITGNKMILVDHIEDIQILSENIKNQITLINAVPSAITFLLDLNWIPAGVNSINLAGESLGKNLVDKLYEISGIEKIYNLYGPSEAATYATCALLQKSSHISPTIGKPITGTCIFLLDHHHQPVPIGTSGEIYIGGLGVGRGYYNHSEQTDKKFLEIAVLNQKPRRFFKTGDLARFTENGELQFLGRIDNQIKLRGFRIEPEEIESVLMSHLDIQQAIVLPQYQRGIAEQLTAWVSSMQKNTLTADQIRDYLKTWLPVYMIPSTIIVIDKMPLTDNGKIDRRKLLDFHSSIEMINENWVEESFSDVEGKILAIWKDLLNAKKITRHDNFFDLGGHSLLLIKMARRLEEIFQIKIGKITLFKYPTIAELARYIKSNLYDSGDMAVIGMSCRFPGAANIEQFWSNLCAGVESIIDIAKIEVIDDEFDKDFFHYTDKEAQLLDPQHRLFLECAWEALENAGYASEHHQGRVGVFSTSEKSDYLENFLKDYLEKNPTLGSAEKFLIKISNDKDYLSTRVSYKLNLTGPSINVQTACSSSLVAIHLARQSLLAGECDLALVGGVALHLPQQSGSPYQEGMIFSADGHCRAFDAKANGTVFGNGAGVVILKPYHKARQDNDHIYAILKGSAINNDGIKKMGFTTPSIEGQAAVIKMALKDARITSDFVHYIEAHGTGTPLGDPIEVAALTQAFAERSPSLPRCALGSVKTNIGHLDGAAGIAGFIKTVLMLKNKQLPPSLHFSSPNPEIDFTNSPFYVCQKLVFWQSFDIPRYAGVSAFGIGGTNAHVILSEAPERSSEEVAGEKMSIFVLPLSAKNQSALLIIVKQYIDFLENNHSQIKIQDVCYTAAVGRTHFSHRLAVAGHDLHEIINNLKNWLGGFNHNQLQASDLIKNLIESYLLGQEVDWNGFYKNKSGGRIPLPTYPFQRQRCWVSGVSHVVRNPLSVFSILGQQIALPFSTQIRFENMFGATQPIYNSHHRLFGRIVVPGSSHLAVFIAALNQIYPQKYYYFNEIFFLQPFILSENNLCPVQVILDIFPDNKSTIKIASCETENWVVHAEGKFQVKNNPIMQNSIDIPAIKSRCLLSMTGEYFYNNVWAPGLDTGDSFRWIKEIWYTVNQEAISYSNPPDNLDAIKESLHPGLIETCFQLLNACWYFDAAEQSSKNYIYVPFSIQSIHTINIPNNSGMYSYAKIRKINEISHSIVADVFLLDDQGKLILEILGFEVRKLYAENLLDKHLHRSKSTLTPPIKNQSVNNVLERILQATTEQRKTILYHYMAYLMQRILGIDSENSIIDYERGFIDYGLDSLMSVELRNQLQADLKLKLSSTFAFDYPTINDAVSHLYQKLISEQIQQEYAQLESILSGVPIGHADENFRYP